jgi:hypothetical protein
VGQRTKTTMQFPQGVSGGCANRSLQLVVLPDPKPLWCRPCSSQKCQNCWHATGHCGPLASPSHPPNSTLWIFRYLVKSLVSFFLRTKLKIHSFYCFVACLTQLPFPRALQKKGFGHRGHTSGTLRMSRSVLPFTMACLKNQIEQICACL